MVVFRYEALQSAGTTVQGRIEAPDERAAATALRERDLHPLSLWLEGEARARGTRPPGRRPVSSRDLTFFFRETALMVRSGVTLLQGLEVCERQSPSKALGALARRLADSIRAGRSLSQSMGREPQAFSRLMVHLVASAEATGELDPVLDRIADTVERRTNLRRSLMTSLAYPTLVFLAAVGVAVFLVVGVVPKFASFFLRHSVAVPWTTRTLLDISVWVQAYGLYLLAAVFVALGTVAYLYFLTPRGRLAVDRAALSVPVVGKLLKVAAFSQITWTLGALLRSGVSLLESIRITSAVTGNSALSRHLEGVGTRILEGGTLSSGMEHALVPPIVPSLIAAGERAGAMTEVLNSLSDHYQNDLELRIRRMSALVEPVLILVVGSMVGFVYLAFFQAVLQLAQR